MRLSVTAICISFFLFCTSDHHSKNKFNDPIIIQIHEQQQHQWRSHLLNDLNHSNPGYRVEAIHALISMYDLTAFNKITELLHNDEHSTVRKSAASYLGSTGSVKAARELIKALSNERDTGVRNQIILSLSNTIKPDQVSVILNGPINDQTKKAYLTSLVTLKLRFFQEPRIAKTAISFINDQHESHDIRLLASYILSISDSSELIGIKKDITTLIQNESDNRISSNLIASIVTLKDPKNVYLLLKAMKGKNWSAKLNSLNGLRGLNFSNKNALFKQALCDSNAYVRVLASEILKQDYAKFDSINYLNEARSNNNWQARLNLYEASYLFYKDENILDELTEIYFSSESLFEKAGCLKIIGLSLNRFRFLRNILFTTNTPILQTTCATVLVGLSKKNEATKMRSEFLEVFTKGIIMKDPTISALFSQVISRNYKDLIDTKLLYDAYNASILDQDNRAAEVIESAICRIEQRPERPANKTIKIPDWNHIKEISKEQQVIIKTSRGDITIKLFIENAPVAVSNFIELINNHYYDSTFINDVIPNSIIQGGCKRGDGFGRMNYYLPFETSNLITDKPTLNMIRAGKEFESTQWYIAHNPYQFINIPKIIIGEVESGLLVLDQLERGDRITSIMLQPLK